MFSKQAILASSLLAMGLVSAQDSTCQGIQVLNACVSSTTALTETCGNNDYDCLCTKWSAVLTCYNECPNDSGVSAAKSQKETYCNDASAYPSSSSIAVSAAATPSSNAIANAAVSSSTSSTATGTGSMTTMTGSSASATATGTKTGSTVTGTAASKTFGSTSSATGESSNKKNGAGVVRIGLGGLSLALVAGIFGTLM